MRVRMHSNIVEASKMSLTLSTSIPGRSTSMFLALRKSQTLSLIKRLVPLQAVTLYPPHY